MRQKLRRYRLKLNYYVNVFFIMNTLSKDFVHCLPRDGSFSKPKKLDFCNFSPAFLPSRSPSRTLNFFALSGAYFDTRKPNRRPSRTPQRSSFQGTTSTATFPLIFSHILPISRPFRGMTSEKISEKKHGNNSGIQPILELITDIWGQQPGLVRGDFWEHVQELFRGNSGE